MTLNNPPPEGPDPFDRLRALAERQLDELHDLADTVMPGMGIAEHERFVKIFAAAIKNSQQLFGSAAAARKSGEELKREDDAIRAEFARRLAAMLRGKQTARAAGPDGEASPSEVSS